VQHGQYHLVSALGGRGEGEAQGGDERRLHHTQPVVAPAGIEVVIRYAIAQQRLVVMADEIFLDR
jgi:hypothetical protein